MLQLVICSDGSICCLYDESIELATLGSVTIRRASHVEPDSQGRWAADLAPAAGPVLGPFAHRTDALAAAQAWLK